MEVQKQRGMKWPEGHGAGGELRAECDGCGRWLLLRLRLCMLGGVGSVGWGGVQLVTVQQCFHCNDNS
jgi:hypothetical protein